MKSILAIFIGITLQLASLPAAIADNGSSYYTVTNIGNPTQANYAGTTPRNPWDMMIYRGMLYIGAGDYDANTGDTPIYAYDLKRNIWQNTGTVPDEAVTKFVTIVEDLYAPGTDPTTNTWAYGNYHQKAQDRWLTRDNLPQGVHHFDMVRYQGAMFYGIGTANHTISPVKISNDNGITYQDVAFYRNGQPIIGMTEYAFFRVYNFFTLKDQLYCLLVATKADGETRESGFYRYTGEHFTHISTAGIRELKRFGLWQVYIGSTATVSNQCYFTTGHLYKTEDFQSFEEIIFPEEKFVTDFVEEGPYVYVLTCKEGEDGSYINTIWQVHTQTEEQEKLLSFQTEDGIGLSLEKGGYSFYVGLGHGAQAGTILKIQPKSRLIRFLGILPRDSANPILPEDWS